MECRPSTSASARWEKAESRQSEHKDNTDPLSDLVKSQGYTEDIPKQAGWSCS